MSEPTNAELVRRVDELVARIDKLVSTLEKQYATKNEVVTVERLHDLRLKELEKDNETSAGFRRQVAAGFIVGFLLLLVPLLGAIQNIAAAGGPTP